MRSRQILAEMLKHYDVNLHRDQETVKAIIFDSKTSKRLRNFEAPTLPALLKSVNIYHKKQKKK